MADLGDKLKQEAGKATSGLVDRLGAQSGVGASLFKLGAELLGIPSGDKKEAGGRPAGAVPARPTGGVTPTIPNPLSGLTDRIPLAQELKDKVVGGAQAAGAAASAAAVSATAAVLPAGSYLEGDGKGIPTVVNVDKLQAEAEARIEAERKKLATPPSTSGGKPFDLVTPADMAAEAADQPQRRTRMDPDDEPRKGGRVIESPFKGIKTNGWPADEHDRGRVPVAEPPKVGPYVEPPKATRADMDGPVTLEPVAVAATTPTAAAFTAATNPPKVMIYMSSKDFKESKVDGVEKLDVTGSSRYMEALRGLIREEKLSPYQVKALDDLMKRVDAKDHTELLSMVQREATNSEVTNETRIAAQRKVNPAAMAPAP